MSADLFDFFTHHELPTPTVTVDEARRLMAENYGFRCDIVELGSQQDQNFMVTEDGAVEPVGILKLSNPAFSEAEIDLQDLAAHTVADREPALRIPRVVVGPRGPMSGWWE